MAANFWESSNCNRWQLSVKSGGDFQPLDKSHFKPAEIKWLRMYFVELLNKVGKRLGFRQRLISTSIVLFKRFYTKESFVNFDPFLVVPTLLLVAAKVEEWPCKVDRLLESFKKTCLTFMNENPYTYDVQDIVECEFYALEVLEFDLIIYHPYRPLQEMLQAMDLIPKEHQGLENMQKHQRKYLEFSWAIVNDSFRTDLCLFYPPFVIAAASIYIMLNFFNEREEQTNFLRKVSKHTTQIVEVATKILDLYDFYQNKKLDTAKLVSKLFLKIRDPKISF